MIKKLLILLCLSMASIGTSSYAYTNGFIYMINAMDIQTVNVNGLAINEEIYNAYNLIVYGSPTLTTSPKQRWKATETGNWTFNSGRYNEIGVRGEYWILGEDYSGNLVHNELFPDDYNSGISPLEWNYRMVKDAEESWNDSSKYQYELQREYMMNQKLSRFDVQYDITALDIGLDKARVENYATWGSTGSIYTEKPGEGNVYWVATFSVEPMAGNAKLNSILNLPNGTEYTIPIEETKIEIPLSFGANVDGLSEYAKAEHVKIIESELKVNSVNCNIVSGTQTLSISKEHNLVINKNDYPNQKEIKIELECNSFMATYFNGDPILYDTEKVVVTVNFESEKTNRVPIINDESAPVIYSCTLKRVTTNEKGRETLVNLYTSNKTKRDFICAGQVMKIEVRTSKDASNVSFDFNGKSSIRTLDDLTLRFEWYDPINRKEDTRYSSLNELKASYNLPRKLALEKETEHEKIFSTVYVIPYGTTQTLHSWNSLRSKTNNAFEIDESMLFTSKESPYRVVVRATNGDAMSTSFIKFDVAERWDALYNRDLAEYVTIKGNR